jgi:hypothetical protein
MACRYASKQIEATLTSVPANSPLQPASGATIEVE